MSFTRIEAICSHIKNTVRASQLRELRTVYYRGFKWFLINGVLLLCPSFDKEFSNQNRQLIILR